MKGSRAKKAAEAEASTGGELEPTPPPGSPDKGPRPGPLVQGKEGSDLVKISAAEFKQIIGQIRTNELLGAAAADSLEAAAGLRPVASPQSKGAKELREKTADSREDDAPKKGGMKFDNNVDEVPDIKESPPAKRGSHSHVVDDDVVGHDMDAMENHCEKDAPEPPELNLSPKQNHMRTDLEMWVMDDILLCFGVDDSEELAENLQEDGQADQITFLIAETDPDKQNAMVAKWLKDASDEEKRDEFSNELLSKVRAIQDMSPKKKKKKKKADA